MPPEKLGGYLRDLRGLMEKHPYEGDFYGHFGQGCLHVRMNFDLATNRESYAYRAFLYEAADLVVSYGGSLSGEHGDGQARAELLPKMFGPELIEAFREFKRLWDPDGRMNPGKVVDAYSVSENLRLGPGYAPPVEKTHFRYREDKGSFGRAVLRCVGVGKCRRLEGGTMCPSFRVTRDEEHSTRGRARLLSRCCAATRSRTAGRAGKSARRSTCASPARDARRTARSTWTWPPQARVLPTLGPGWSSSVGDLACPSRVIYPLDVPR